MILDDKTYRELSQRIDPFLFSAMDSPKARTDAWRNIHRILAEYAITDDEWIREIERRLPDIACNCVTLDIPGHDQHCDWCTPSTDDDIPY